MGAGDVHVRPAVLLSEEQIGAAGGWQPARTSRSQRGWLRSCCPRAARDRWTAVRRTDQATGSSRAPAASRQSRSELAPSDRGVIPAANDMAAAVPAAWPIAMQVAIERADACAS